MKWFWKVRIYRPDGNYGVCQVETNRSLTDIIIQRDFYYQLTGAKMLLEGMMEYQWEHLPYIGEVFNSLFEPKLGEDKR